MATFTRYGELILINSLFRKGKFAKIRKSEAMSYGYKREAAMSVEAMLFLSLAILTVGIVLIYKVYSHIQTSRYKSQSQIIKNITAEKAHILVRENADSPNFVILDVRTPKEFSEGRIENAVNLDFHSENFREELDKLDKDKTYIVHCAKGVRSRKTLNVMKELGFKEAYNMKGGIVKWKEKGFSTIK